MPNSVQAALDAVDLCSRSYFWNVLRLPDVRDSDLWLQKLRAHWQTLFRCPEWLKMASACGHPCLLVSTTRSFMLSLRAQGWLCVPG
jgi:hypothetical protein